MNLEKRHLLATALLISIVGCGGGGSEAPSDQAPASTSAATAESESGASTSEETAEKATGAPSSELPVSEGFDFRSDRDVDVYIASVPSGPGVIKLYHATAFYDEDTRTHYPDYESLIATWRVEAGAKETIAFNRNWEGLLVAWVPETAAGMEQYLYFPADEIEAGLTVSL